jgi:hypothetical protein
MNNLSKLLFLAAFSLTGLIGSANAENKLDWEVDNQNVQVGNKSGVVGVVKDDTVKGDIGKVTGIVANCGNAPGTPAGQTCSCSGSSCNSYSDDVTCRSGRVGPPDTSAITVCKWERVSCHCVCTGAGC